MTSAPVPVLVLNGPNLGRLGTREPDIYGRTTHPELAALCIRAGAELGVSVDVRQSDHEGELLGWLHEAADTGSPVVLNAGALTHTSIALGDACAMLTAPLIEVHISNVHRRESFRHTSYVSAHATGVIVGLGVEGYVLALSWLSSSAAESDASAATASSTSTATSTAVVVGSVPHAGRDTAAAEGPSGPTD